LPAIGCEAVVNAASARCLALRRYRFYDCYAADRRQASSYRAKRTAYRCVRAAQTLDLAAVDDPEVLTKV